MLEEFVLLFDKTSHPPLCLEDARDAIGLDSHALTLAVHQLVICVNLRASRWPNYAVCFVCLGSVEDPTENTDCCFEACHYSCYVKEFGWCNLIFIVKYMW